MAKGGGRKELEVETFRASLDQEINCQALQHTDGRPSGLSQNCFVLFLLKGANQDQGMDAQDLNSDQQENSGQWNVVCQSFTSSAVL